MSEWTSERDQILREMLDARYSFGVIGQRLNISRNACIGRARRLGLECLRQPGFNGGGSLQELQRKRSDPPMPQVTQDMLVPLRLENGANVTMVDLTARSCRWPIGHPTDRDFHFCGHKTIPGKTYCPHHHRMAFQKHRA